MASVTEPPVGTVTLLFTDIEGSTSLAHALGTDWPGVLAEHHRLVGGAISDHGGYVDGTDGDAFFAVFEDARAGLVAAVDAQRQLRERSWPDGCGTRGLRVRMGLHTGFVEREQIGYVGLEIHRAARVGAAANGGQILITEATRRLALDVVETEDLGLHRLRDFPTPEPLYSVVIDGERASSFPPPRTLSVRPTNLPPDDRPLLGRDRALAELVSCFVSDSERLVTVTGIGGTGKTRLALAAAGALLDDHPGGVWLVPLATTPDAAAILPRVAAAIGIADDGEQPLADALRDRVAERPTLVVLDNLEQIRDAGTAVTSLLDAVPPLRVLATSQAPLRLGHERVFPLASLEPSPARDLFLQSAARTRPDLSFNDADLAAIDAVCERLGHLPLALELAAARLSVLTPAQLDERLATSLDLLRVADPDRPERQRSLRAAISWTLDLLDPGPRSLFTRLGSFAGPATLDDIEVVCGGDGLDVLDDLAALLDVGVVRRREDGTGTVRFALPEALRQTAAAELDADAAVSTRWRRAHAEHTNRVLWNADAGTGTAAQFTRAMAQEMEIWPALLWSLEHDRALAPALAAAWAALLSDTGRIREARDLAQLALDSTPPPEPRTKALALSALGHNQLILNDRAEATAAFDEALVLLADDDPLRACVLVQLGLSVGFIGGQMEDWAAANDEAVALGRRTGSATVQAFALSFRAQERNVRGLPDEAEVALDEAEELAVTSGAKALWYIPTLRADIGLARGDAPAAAAAYLTSMAAARERGDRLQEHFDLHGLAASIACAGNDRAAMEVYGIARAHAEDLGSDLGELWEDVPYNSYTTEARDRLGAAASDAVEQGRSCPPGLRHTRARELAMDASPVAADQPT